MRSLPGWAGDLEAGLGSRGADMIDLNTATLEQLAALPGLDRATVCDLVLWRPYWGWEDFEVPALAHIDTANLIAVGAIIIPPDTRAWSIGAAFQLSSSPAGGGSTRRTAGRPARRDSEPRSFSSDPGPGGVFEELHTARQASKAQNGMPND